MLVAVGTLVAVPGPPAAADTTPQPLPLTQDWSNDGAIKPTTTGPPCPASSATAATT